MKTLLKFFHFAVNYHRRHYGPRFTCGELAVYQLNASTRAASGGGNYKAVTSNFANLW
jgi:hypothetical protein